MAVAPVIYEIHDPSGNLIIGVKDRKQLRRLLRFMERRERPVVVTYDREGMPIPVTTEEV